MAGRQNAARDLVAARVALANVERVRPYLDEVPDSFEDLIEDILNASADDDDWDMFMDVVVHNYPHWLLHIRRRINARDWVDPEPGHRLILLGICAYYARDRHIEAFCSFQLAYTRAHHRAPALLATRYWRGEGIEAFKCRTCYCLLGVLYHEQYKRYHKAWWYYYQARELGQKDAASRLMMLERDCIYALTPYGMWKPKRKYSKLLFRTHAGKSILAEIGRFLMIRARRVLPSDDEHEILSKDLTRLIVQYICTYHSGVSARSYPISNTRPPLPTFLETAVAPFKAAFELVKSVFF